MTDSNQGGGGFEGRAKAHPIYNWMSGIGAALVAVGLTAAAFLTLLDLVAGRASGYSGLTLLLPVGLVGLGLLLGVAGWLRERRRHARGRYSSFYQTWVVDPWGIVRGRGLWFVPLVVAAGTFALFSAGAGTVGLLEVSESNAFCTQACHMVMGPEGTAYADTAHSRIACVECHVGAGPEGFLSAKLGGLRQLYAVASGTVSRPIPTPIHAGNITRKRCEGCHLPERDVGYVGRAHAYFHSGADVESNRMVMMVKVGRGPNGLLPGEGVHYHMQIAHKVEFIARDAQRQEIAWVRATDAKGKAREYQLQSKPLSDAERASLPARTMECIDCHSRPAHRFPSATESVNRALEGRLLPRDLPSIKEVAVLALDGGYESTPAALEGIDRHVRESYEREHPELLKERAEAVEASIATLRKIYQRTIFPEMKADWRAHPDNSGHLYSPGCFRCHNDGMVDSEGRSIATDCTTCHAIVAQTTTAAATTADFEKGEPFIHPMDGSAFEQFMPCSDCHTGGREIYQ
jgi:nitrate/TMAO reductase-like tetraheme cytochrome c subunit